MGRQQHVDASIANIKWLEYKKQQKSNEKAWANRALNQANLGLVSWFLSISRSEGD